MVNINKEGSKKKTSFIMEKKLIPLLTYKSIICRILPMIKTKVSTNKIMKKTDDVSLNIYLLIILYISSIKLAFIDIIFQVKHKNSANFINKKN